MSEAKFNRLRADYLAMSQRYDRTRDALVSKYGHYQYQVPYSKREACERTARRRDRAADAFYDLLDKISPRDWRHGISYAWVLTKLTYQTATTHGPLAESDISGYFADHGKREFMSPVTELAVKE